MANIERRTSPAPQPTRKPSRPAAPRPASPAIPSGEGFGECGPPDSVIDHVGTVDFRNAADRQRWSTDLNRRAAIRPPVPMAIPRSDHVVILDRGTVTIIGGRDTNGRPVAAVERWSGGRWQGLGLLPQAVSHPMVADKGVTIRVIGGRGASGKPSATVALFDGTKWKRLADWPRPRFNAAVLIRPSGLVLVAGGTVDNRPTAAVDVWDGKTWREGHPLSVPRYSASRSDNLLADGYGSDLNKLTSVDEYDDSTGRWNLIGSRDLQASRRADPQRRSKPTSLPPTPNNRRLGPG